MKIDPVAVEQAGELMLIGMGGVFIVLFIIYIVAKLLLKFAPAKKRRSNMATLKRIWLALNPQEAAAWQALLTTAGLAADRQVDHTVGIFEGETLLATGSLSGNIIKEVAVTPATQHENLLAQVIQALLDRLDDDEV